MNLVREFLEVSGDTVEEYDSYCLELANVVIKYINRDNDTKILYIEDPDDRLWPTKTRWPHGWANHAVVFVDGLVHDAEFKYAMPVKDYLRAMFPNNEVLHLTYFLPERLEIWRREGGFGKQGRSITDT